MKKITEFKNGDIIFALEKLSAIVYNFLADDDDLQSEVGGSSSNIVNGNRYFYPALFSAVKKSESLFFCQISVRSKYGSSYNFELDIDINNDNSNSERFYYDYGD